MINFLPAARIGDMTVHGGVIVMALLHASLGKLGRHRLALAV